MNRLVSIAVFLLWVLLVPIRSAAVCVGDCDSDGKVTVDEIIRGVCTIICLEPPFLPEACPPLDPGGRGQVTIDAAVTAVNNTVNGCPNGAGAQ